MATKQNNTVWSYYPQFTTITHRIILPTLCSVVFILCYGVPFNGKNVIHTPNDMKGNYYLNSSKSIDSVSLYPKRHKKRIKLSYI